MIRSKYEMRLYREYAHMESGDARDAGDAWKYVSVASRPERIHRRISKDIVQFGTTWFKVRLDD